MITRIVIGLILLSLVSSADATMLLRDYKSPKDRTEKILYKMYLDGVKDGIVDLNAVLRAEGRPLFCMPENSALHVEQAENIIMHPASTTADPDSLSIAVLLIEGLKETFPCDEKH
jgi:Rap1a immunity proteins